MTTNTSTEQLTGYTTREATFAVVNPSTREVTDIRRFPAGTEVVCKVRGDVLRARIPGTCYTQDLYFSAVRPA